jgi:hypothetical protein
MKDLRQWTIRGGLRKVEHASGKRSFAVGLARDFGRPLEPKDFGMLGMVTVCTGGLSLFRVLGSRQRASVTEERFATLFWINALVATIIALVSCRLAAARVSWFIGRVFVASFWIQACSGFVQSAIDNSVAIKARKAQSGGRIWHGVPTLCGRLDLYRSTGNQAL